jgi:hypothetical protein
MKMQMRKSNRAAVRLLCELFEHVKGDVEEGCRIVEIHLSAKMLRASFGARAPETIAGIPIRPTRGMSDDTALIVSQPTSSGMWRDRTTITAPKEDLEQ